MMDGDEFLLPVEKEVVTVIVDAAESIRNDETTSSPLVVVDLGSGDEQESLDASSNSTAVPEKKEMDDGAVSIDEKFLKLQSLMAELDALKLEQDTFRSEQQQWSSLLQERDEVRREVNELRQVLVRTEEHHQDRIGKLKTDYETRLTKVQKERDSMVVKYAHSEKEAIVANNQRDASEKKCKDLVKERDVLLEKVKAMNAEKTRICNMLEAKSNEYFASQREIDRLKDLVNSKEIKIRWAEGKLKGETESHQETQGKYEKSVQQIRQLKDEMEEAKRLCNEVKNSKESVAADAKILEEKARQIVDRQTMEEQIQMYRTALKEFDSIKIKHTQLSDENSKLLTKVQSMEREKGEREQSVGHWKEQVDQQRQSLIQAQTKLAELDGVQAQLERERERLSEHQEELQRVRQENDELQEESTRCRAKEVELLEFTQRLTEMNVRIQSELTALREQAPEAEAERRQLIARLDDSEARVKCLLMELADERENRLGESAVWTRSVTDKSRLCEDLQTQVRELSSELASIRRKHAANVKEIMRELRATKKRLDQYETTTGPSTVSIQSHDATSLGSRTSSSTSINTTGINDHHSPVEAAPSPPPLTPSGLNHSGPDWERNALLEKMVRVQRDNARKMDKIDFLEEHVRELLGELKKKNRIIQYYLMREESGALASEASDKHKAEMAKHGGIMSSMYNVKTLDDGLNLELCLEINQKLQTVLEDTLIKNMTLKDNLSTLGAEVARITQQHQTLLQSK